LEKYRILVLRMMKHKLDRKSLEKLYIGFIRPILEYGGIVWDNCSLHESELLLERNGGSKTRINLKL
jgi:hypothetical protein